MMDEVAVSKIETSLWCDVGLGSFQFPQKEELILWKSFDELLLGEPGGFTLPPLFLPLS
jgi:hypothetical protein